MFTIDGIDELAEAMSSWRERLESEAAPNVVQRCLDIAQEIAIQEVPVDTGNLRDSIQQSIEDQYYGELVAEAEYAGFVEFGTSKMEAQPYMEPASAEVERNIQDITAEEIENALS